MKKAILYTVSLVVLSCICLSVDMQAKDAIISISFGIILLQSIFEISKDKSPYSLNQFYWLFNMLFFAIAPYIQYYNGVFPWVNRITETEITRTNIYIILINTLYVFVRLVLRTRQNSMKRKGLQLPEDIYKVSLNPNNRWNIFPSSRYYTITFSVFLVCVVILIALVGFGNLFLRAYSGDNINQYEISSSTKLVLDKVLRGGIFFYVLLTLYYYSVSKSKMSILWVVLVVLLGVITNFPTGIPRYLAGAFYIGLLFSIKRRFKRNYIPILTVFVILFFVFPALSATRRADFNLQERLSNSINQAALSFLSGDFDAYTMVNQTFEYINEKSITMGGQLLGSFFFFIPRSVWPTKPIGSGARIAEDQSFGFSNVSCPFIAEGVINFGLIGGVAFVTLLAIFIYKFDSFYWRRIHAGRLNHFWVLMYPPTLGFLVFVLRGDLLSSISYYIGISIGALVLYFINRVKQRGSHNVVGYNHRTVEMANY